MKIKRETEAEEQGSIHAGYTTDEKRQDELGDLDELLYDRLVQYRNGLAAVQHTPVYMVARNIALRKMARIRPVNEKELQSIYWIGPRLVEKYGSGWLEIIETFLAEYKNRLEPSTQTRGVKRCATV